MSFRYQEGMATIAVRLVLEKLASLIAEETQLLKGVRGGIEQLQDDLLSMKSFLHDAEPRIDSDQSLITWVQQVRDIAYDAEDVLEQFMLQSLPFRDKGFIHSVLKCYHFIPKLKAQHGLAVRVREIKGKLKAISDRRSAFSFNMAASSNSRAAEWHDPRVASLYIDESDVVGIENPKTQLLEWLLEEEKKLTSISVVGMGGLGKTTLVKKVYDSHIIRSSFGCHCWITVSKSFATLELLRDALKGFLEATKEPAPNGMDSMTSIQLFNAIREHLQQKRYVIVLDDIWNEDAWESIKYAFPDCGCGSRIILTTRLNNLTMDNTAHIYHLQPLAEKEAWTLFCMKAFRGEHNACTQELEVISRSILKKCEGLPLAVVAIGGLLSKKSKDLLEWKRVYDRLAMELKGENQLGNLGRILLLSYDDLPYHLKQCYLYLSIFPEDYLIKRTKLNRLWIVERFVEEKQGIMMEEVAEGYLNELVTRSLIQVVEMDHFNRARTCRVHDLMREIIQMKSREESLVVIMNDQSIISTKEKVRRLSIHENSNYLPSDTSFRYLRSLLVFTTTQLVSSSLCASFHSFKLLRVLELEGASLSEFPSELVELIQLRYLSMQRTMIREIPDSIGKLKNLEFIDLKHTLVSSLPSGILQSKSISRICVYRYRFMSSPFFADTYGMKVPLGIGRLTSLEKLGSVEIEDDHQLIRELGKLTQLRRLGILMLREEHGTDLCYSLDRMKQLTSLYMVSININEVLHLDSVLSPPKNMQRLYLKCRLTNLPGWIASLQYLSKLVLQYSNLESDPLRALKDLPSLVVLELRQAYAGEELCCGSRGYLRLKRLVFSQLDRLQQIKFAVGAMPGLRRLEIIACERLEEVPDGIEHLKNVEELLLWDMPGKIFETINRSHGEDFWRVQHIPTITSIYETHGSWAAKTVS